MIPSMDNIFCWVSVGVSILTIEPSAKISIPPEGKLLLIELHIIKTKPNIRRATKTQEADRMLAPGAHSQFGSGKNTQFEPEQRANPFENVFSKTAVFPPPAIAETDL